jgi:hypothetical protein
MAKRLKAALLAVAVGSMPVPALAQMSAAPIPAALPDVSSISQANAAGVLQYCEKYDLVSSAVTDGVLEPLTARKEVTSSPAYAAGQTGHILTAGGKTFSLGTANDYLKSQACDLVLQQAKNFK